MRFISMKHFKSPASIKRCVMNRETIVLGQIVGEVNGSLLKTGRLADGTEVSSYVLLGDFAGVCYEHQAQLVAAGKSPDEAEIHSESIYMPKWFAEAVVAKLQINKRIEFAVEILVMPTPEGQTIMYQYDVKSLIARPVNSPVERMKRVLAEKGVLRLAAPQSVAIGSSVHLGHGAEPEHNPETGELSAEAVAGFPEPTDPEDTDASEGAAADASEGTSAATFDDHKNRKGKK